MYQEEGEKLLLTKFHNLLNFVHYTKLHGSNLNLDGSWPEIIGKVLTKDPGKRTQNRMTCLTHQVAMRLFQTQEQYYFFSTLFQYHNIYFHNYKFQMKTFIDAVGELHQDSEELLSPLPPPHDVESENVHHKCKVSRFKFVHSSESVIEQSSTHILSN